MLGVLNSSQCAFKIEIVLGLTSLLANLAQELIVKIKFAILEVIKSLNEKLQPKIVSQANFSCVSQDKFDQSAEIKDFSRVNETEGVSQIDVGFLKNYLGFFGFQRLITS